MPSSTKIGVAVGKGSSRLNALQWALQNENFPGDTVYLLHVFTQQSILHVEKGRVADASVHEGDEALSKRKREIEEDCIRICREKKINPEFCYAEGPREAVPKKLIELISELSLSKLVLGTSSRNPLTSTFGLFKNKSIPKFVVKNAPEFCSVLVIYKGKQIFRKEIKADTPDPTVPNIDQDEISPVQTNVREKWQDGSLIKLKEYERRCEEATTRLNIALREQETLRQNLLDLGQNLHDEIQKHIETQNVVNEYERELNTVKNQIEQERKTFVESLEDVKNELERESQLRKEAEERAIKEHVEKEDIIATLEELQKQMDLRKQKITFTTYSWEDIVKATDTFNEANKLGGGRVGYGRPVYKGKLHDEMVAIKFLAEDEAESGFQKLVGHLAHIRHPNVVMPLGVCGTWIVSEYMSNGSLEDHLVSEYMSQRNLADHLTRKKSSSLPWYVRLRICSEVASGLLYLHSHPECIAHHNLKPRNILLDHNYVSKISYIGIGKLVHNRLKLRSEGTMPIEATEYTDPDYQSTGVFSCESDVYALGIIILQLLTGQPPMGIANYVDAAIDCSRLHGVLDKSAGEWPLEIAMELACVALNCAEPRREDRANLEKDVIPVLRELNSRLKPVPQDPPAAVPFIPSSFICPIVQEIMNDPHIAADGHTYEYEAIKLWLRDHTTSPMTNLKLPRSTLIPNVALRSAIKEFREKGWI